ncbi:MAG: putative polysaccharide biosynthesis protein [Syntrophothermus sp.]
MRKQSFLQGAAILVVAGLASRLLGAILRILLPRLLGAEAIGVLEMATPVYTLFTVIAIAGLPVTVSKLVAEQAALRSSEGVFRVFHVATAFFILVGITFSFLLIISARSLASRVLGDFGAFYSIVVFAPAIVFLSVAAALRGFFQGLQDMVPSAISQIAEQVVRVPSILFFAVTLLPYGVEYGAAGAALGGAVGAGAGAAILVVAYLRSRKKLRKEIGPARPLTGTSTIRILHQVLYLAVPIVIGALIAPVMSLLDAVIVPRQLQKLGITMEVVRRLFGELNGMAMVLAIFPSLLTQSLAISLVPAVAGAMALKDHKLLNERVEDAIRLSIMFGLPAATGLLILAEPICSLLYNDPAAAIPLVYLAPGIPFLCLQDTTVGIQQGMGRVREPVWYLFYGAVVKGVLTYVLTGIPSLGVRGAALATVIGFAVTAVLNLRAVYRQTGIRFNLWNLVAKPAFNLLLMVIVVNSVYSFLGAVSILYNSRVNNAVSTLGAVMAGAVVYLLGMAISGGLQERDLQVFGRVGNRLALLWKGKE